jgi:hypothetical protein
MELSKSMTQIEKTQKVTNISRRQFMKLPLEERRRILVKQAELMLPHYQQDKEWQELDTGKFVDY